MSVQAVDALFVRLRVLATDVTVSDLLTATDPFDKSLRLICGETLEYGEEVPLSSRSDGYCMCTTGEDLQDCTPGRSLSVPYHKIFHISKDISPAKAISSISAGIRAVSALTYKVPGQTLKGATVLLINAGDPFSQASLQLCRIFGVHCCILHTRQQKEYEYVIDWAPVTTDAFACEVVPPGEDIVTAVMAHTAGCGVHAVLDISAFAELMNKRCVELKECVAAAGKDIERIGQLVSSRYPTAGAATYQVPEIETLTQCLGVSGHLVTTRSNVELDSPLTNLLRLKDASIHLMHDLVWEAAPTSVGKLIHIMDACIVWMQKGMLNVPTAIIHLMDEDGAATRRMALGMGAEDMGLAGMSDDGSPAFYQRILVVML